MGTLLVLFSAAAVYEAVNLSAVMNPEVWLHLRTGVWILQRHSIPKTGLFSQYSDLAWNDSTWGFDLILGSVYRLFGVRGIPMLLILLKVALAVLTFLLARTARLSFWGAVLLSAIAQYVIPHVQPLPYVFSILFFGAELILLIRSRESGSNRPLYWLPLLFLFWANIHLQFVAGLVLLGVYSLAALAEHLTQPLSLAWIKQSKMSVELKNVATVALASLLVTLINPYGFRLFPAAFNALYSPVAFEHFTEMSSITFRHPQDYVLMLLVMTAFLAMGRRRSLDLFELFALLGSTLLAFRVERDSWFVVLTAIAVLSQGFSTEPQSDERPTVRSTAWPAAFSLAMAVAAGLLIVPGSNRLMEKAGKDFPVKASDYIRSNRLSGPLFNEYSWGSFLTWYLPEYPVVIDSRVELYGDQILGRYFDIVAGKELLESDPTVARTGVLLLERQSAMAKALTNLPALAAQYRLVYSDDIASVFVPQKKRP